MLQSFMIKLYLIGVFIAFTNNICKGFINFKGFDGIVKVM